jgi:CHAT domain-containing protein/Tfp pilus assembly protein PilF
MASLNKIPGFNRYLLYLILIFAAASVVSLLQTCSTPSILVTQEQTIGDTYFNKHDYREAARHYELMLNASSKLGIYRNLSMESDVHRKIADCHEMSGDYDKALLHIRDAVKLDSADNNLLGRIEDYRHEGKIFIYMGSYQRGIFSIEKSLALSEGMDQSLKNDYKLAIADNFLVLGQLYSVMGRLDKSQEYIGRALSLFEQAADRQGEMESYLTIGSVFSDLGDIETARNFIKKSLKIAGELEMGTARHNQLLASLSASLGEYEDAVRYQEQALDNARKFGIMGQIVWATIGMGDLYYELGDTKRAGKYYKQAREMKDTLSMKAGSLQASLDMRLGELMNANQYFVSEKSISGEGISSLRLSEMMLSNDKPDSALLFLEQSDRSFAVSRNKQGIANVKLLKGRIFVDKGDYFSAKRLLDSACRVNEYPETVWQAWFHLGRMYENQGQDDLAMESYRKSISVIEQIRGNLTIDEFKSIYFDSKREVYDRLINLLIKNKRPVDAFSFSEQARARAFYDILANKKIDFRGSSAGDLILMEQEKRIEIQKLFKLLQKGEAGVSENEETRSVDLMQVRSALTEARDEYMELVQKIKLNNPSYAEIIAVSPVELSDLQSRLDPETALIAYWISDDKLISWMITHSGVISRETAVSSIGLERLIEKTRKAIQSNSPEESRADLSELYRLLIAPFESNLKEFSSLVIIPNGSLHFLPFQALIDTIGEYMIQKFSLLYAPSASVYILCNDRLIKTGSKFMGIALGDISVDNNVGLPGTEDELKRILPLFPDNISTFGDRSTETFVRNNAGNFNFIHFATHGSYNYRQPLYSSLILPPSDEDDGKLYVYEVFEMNINAKLVTLSACETGLGNISQGDELTGLSRAFLFAGSSAVVVSLWSVADYPTALLMTNFYRYLKDHSLQEALTLAQRDVIKVYSQPLYWSPFILIGNGYVSMN